MPETHRFTERWLARVVPPKKDDPRLELWDAVCPGLHVIVRPTGRKVYFFRHRGRRKKLGEVVGEGPVAQRKLDAGIAIPLTEARRMAEERRTSPQARAALQARTVQTFQHLYEHWLERQAPSLKENSRKEYVRTLERDVLPEFGGSIPETIQPEEVIGWLEGIGEPEPYGRGKPSQANHAKAYFASVLRWGAKKRLIKVNPLAGVEWRYEPGKKATVYNSREIAALWRDWCHRGGFGVRVFKLVLCTIQRPGEVLEMRWNAIETIRGKTVWRIESEDTKNGMVHFVPLEPLALEVLEELRPLTGTGEWVFPHHHDASRPMVSYNREMQKCRKRTGINRFDVHSLRRTGASWMETLGVELPVIQAVLNHAKPGATGHYVFAQGASPACRDAIQVLEGHLRSCIESTP